MRRGFTLAMAVVAGLALAVPLAAWMGGSGHVLGVRLGAYQPPPLAAGWSAVVSAEARKRGVTLGQPDPFREFIGYRDRTNINVYRGEWSATRDGKQLTISIGAEATHGKWRVTRWHER